MLLILAASVAPIGIETTGMQPQLQAIRKLAAARGWSVSCEGRAGEEGVLRLKAPLGTGERRVFDPLLAGDFDGAPAFRERARVPSLRAFAAVDARPCTWPRTAMFHLPLACAAYCIGPAAALHGVSIGIRGRFPSWSRRVR